MATVCQHLAQLSGQSAHYDLRGQPPTGRTRRATAGGSRVCGLWGLLAQYPAPLTGRPGS
ncbi:hypothetical protein, partial [Streptomyces sp. NPDC058672]|uniref:hypothetical protein n=1 Tax=Streptomyces sp. NPDC058672 TaxID=3346591 RepID=UPI0036625642